MSSIQTGIELNDQFSGVLNNIISSVNLAVSAMYDMQQSMNADIDTSSIEGANRGVIGGNPNLIYPGQVLTIPAA